MKNYTWAHKDLLDVDTLSLQDVNYLFDMATQFDEINSRAIKKVPTLRGKGIILFFAENSTRTKTSFDIAGKRLSADTFSLAKSGSSLSKGESLKDTAFTLEAMNPNIIVIRHASSGAAAFLAERLSCSIINAGDGWHAHPTQALLDAYTLHKYWQGNLSGKSVLIVGDIAHSRVARSNIKLLNKLGVNIRVFAPKTLLPYDLKHFPVSVYDNLPAALKDVDAVMSLRLQLERQTAGLLPNLAEYAARFCISSKLMQLAAPNAPILHPGPINRGMEITSELADSEKSYILEQVHAGVAMRMALLFSFGTLNEAVSTDEVKND